MADSKEVEVQRLQAKIADLKADDVALEKRGTDLKGEAAVYANLAEPSHVPSPIGGTDSTPSLEAQLKARELRGEIDHVDAERKRIADELPATETALTGAKQAVAEEVYERENELAKSTVENVAELATSQVGPLDGVGELGGTGSNVADAVVYTLRAAPIAMDFVKQGYAFNTAVADDLARPYERSDEMKLMHEQTVHEQNLQELSDMKERAAEMREKDLTDKDRNQAIDDANASFKKQDEALAKMHEEMRVSDEALRQQQDVARAAMEAETNAKRHEVAQELLAPVAERNVQEQHAEQLSRNAANNQQHLDTYGMTLEGRPDAAKVQAEYAKFLEQDQKGLQETLDTQRSQDVQREMSQLQQQHFPEVTPPAMSGPAGPQQSGPSGTSGPAGPQQSGPSGMSGPSVQQHSGPSGPGM